MKDAITGAAHAVASPSTILTETQLAHRWQMSVKTLQANRWKGKGCPYFKAGRLVRYRIEDVLQFEWAQMRLADVSTGGGGSNA